MLRKKTGEAAGSGGTALAERRQTIIDPSQVVRVIGERLAQRLWPIQAEVHQTCTLPLVSYPEDDFWRVVEVLIGRAITAFPPSTPDPHAMIGARSDGQATFFSIHSPGANAFRDGGESSFPEFRTWEAKAIVEKNGGRFWVDERSGDGSTAYFTIKNC